MALILLRSIANKVSSGLSPDEQHNMFRLLEEALAERRRLESQMETLIAQNQTLESHLLELKAAVQHQREIPAQVMLLTRDTYRRFRREQATFPSRVHQFFRSTLCGHDGKVQASRRWRTGPDTQANV
jgi:hypothetical protein